MVHFFRNLNFLSNVKETLLSLLAMNSGHVRPHTDVQGKGKDFSKLDREKTGANLTNQNIVSTLQILSEVDYNQALISFHRCMN